MLDEPLYVYPDLIKEPHFDLSRFSISCFGDKCNTLQGDIHCLEDFLVALKQDAERSKVTLGSGTNSQVTSIEEGHC